MSPEKVEKILAAAVRAPSGDNVQPWDVRVSKNFTQLDLYNLPEKDDSVYNYQQVASYIAHGAFLENLLIAARHLGCQADYQLFPDSQNEEHIAQIKLTDSPPEEQSYYPVIFKRRTNRFVHQKTKISTATLNTLKNSIKSIKGVKVYLVTDQEKIKKIADIFKLNDRIVFENKLLHDFLFDKIRWNKKQMEEIQDGMPVNALGLNPVEKMFFPLLRFWGYVKVANVFGLSKLIELKGWWRCRQASLSGVLVIKGIDNAAFVEGGRAVQRLWLETTRQGLAFQPIIGLPLLIRQFKEGCLQGISETHKSFIQQANEKSAKLFGLDEDEIMIMGFRAGAVKQTGFENRTLRKQIFNKV